ncbi:LuxR C-terminal-related transcriptional regulator [Saccharopolyspora shandongensis]|uniref:ATP-binding protein n=1 Tax=Saccharopolyspora shandongensis TaxID=418495 RepID=UPI0033EEDC9B
MAEVKGLLSRARLVTLTGPGGVGKSRLALRLAEDLRRAFPDGVWLVKLAELDDDSLVARAVASSLQLRDRTARAPEDVLVDHLADKQLLLVLDNCEHLRDACGYLVATLLEAAPKLHVLATSREPLMIGGEHIWQVPPMSVPTDNTLVQGTAREYEALKLFEDRASAVNREFTLGPDNEQTVARLCGRLDGLPLAIELAAVLIRALSVEQILVRLKDRYRLLTEGKRAGLPRHQTLRATMEWSFDLCTQQEQVLWSRLSVFPGEFDIESAQQVCADGGLSPDEVFMGVVGLVEKSILIREQHHVGSRYRFLSTIRDFGHEQLGTDGALAALRRKHRDYYLDLAEQADANWFGPHQLQWFSRLQLDQASLWAALEYCLTEPGEARAGLRMAGALWFYWVACSSPQEGREWLDRALTLDLQPSQERTKALWVNGYLAIRQGDTDAALSMLNECSRLARVLDDQAALAHAAQLSGHAELVSNNLTQAVPLLEQALSQERALGRPSTHLATALFRLALARCLTGDADRGLSLCQECEKLCRAHGEQWSRSWMLWILAVIRWTQGDLQHMTAHLRECLRIERPLSDPLNIALCVEALAWVEARNGNGERAAELLAASHKLWRPLGEYLLGFHHYMDWHDQCEAHARRAVGDKTFEASYQRGAGHTVDEIVVRALNEKTAAVSGSQVESEAGIHTLLTPREREVAQLVAQGLSNKEIAAHLAIKRRTAESHIEHILTKLGFTSRGRIAALFWEQQRG